jgi:hypothetical protein
MSFRKRISLSQDSAVLPLTNLFKNPTRRETISPCAGHRILSESPESVIGALYLQGITCARYYAHGQSGVVYEIPNSQLIKITPESRIHATGHPSLLDHLVIAKIGKDQLDEYVITCQPIIHTMGTSVTDVDRINQELARVEGKDSLDFVTIDDVGFITHEGNRVPLCFDIHESYLGMDLTEKFKTSYPQSLWVEDCGEWIQYRVFPDLKDKRISGTVSIETVIDMIHSMNPETRKFKYENIKIMVGFGLEPKEIPDMIELTYHVQLSSKARVLLAGYYEHELAQIFGETTWQQAMSLHQRGELSSDALNVDAALLESRELIVKKDRSISGDFSLERIHRL